MKKIAKKLSLDRQIIRNLGHLEFRAAQGGRINETRSACEGECLPGTEECTTGPNTNGNFCLKTELTCVTC